MAKVTETTYASREAKAVAAAKKASNFPKALRACAAYGVGVRVDGSMFDLNDSAQTYSTAKR